MDDIAPLRQLAASFDKRPRVRPTESAQPDVARASLQTKVPVAQPFRAGPSAVKPFAGSTVFLFTPAPAYRMHYQPSGGRPDWPEYPPVGARIDYYLPNPSGDVKLEIVDAAGKTVREYSNASNGPAAGGRGGRRGGNLPSTLPTKAGTNRFVWDLRYGDAGGPMIAPGAYRARLTVNGVTRTEPLTVKIDPRVLKDGVTTADLAEQTKFAPAGHARPAGDGREPRRSGRAAERVEPPDDEAWTVRGSDVHRSALERLARDRASGPEGRRERVRALQRSDQGVDDDQGRRGEGSTLRSICPPQRNRTDRV
jgi:hypothetical protein